MTKSDVNMKNKQKDSSLFYAIRNVKEELRNIEKVYAEIEKENPEKHEKLKYLESKWVNAKVKLAVLEALSNESSPFEIKVCPDIVFNVNESWLEFSDFDLSKNCKLRTKMPLSLQKVAAFNRELNEIICALIQLYYDVNYLKSLIKKYTCSEQVTKEDITRYCVDKTIKEEVKKYLNFLHSDKMLILSSVIHAYFEAYIQIEGLK